MTEKTCNEKGKFIKRGEANILATNFFSILADSSFGSITSTAHPIASLAFKFSNSSSLFSSFRVFESACNQTESRNMISEEKKKGREPHTYQRR